MAGKTRTVVVKKARRRKKNGFTLPVAVIAGMVPLGQLVKDGYDSEGVKGAAGNLARFTTGIHVLGDGKFHLRDIARGTMPVIIGGVVHKFANKLGVNRALASSGIPFLRF